MSFFGFAMSGKFISAFGALIVLIGAYISSEEEDAWKETLLKTQEDLSKAQVSIYNAQSDPTIAVQELTKLRKENVEKTIEQSFNHKDLQSIKKGAKDIADEKHKLEPNRIASTMEIRNEFEKAAIPVLTAFLNTFKIYIEDLDKDGRITDKFYQEIDNKWLFETAGTLARATIDDEFRISINFIKPQFIEAAQKFGIHISLAPNVALVLLDNDELKILFPKTEMIVINIKQLDDAQTNAQIFEAVKKVISALITTQLAEAELKKKN